MKKTRVSIQQTTQSLVETDPAATVEQYQANGWKVWEHPGNSNPEIVTLLHPDISGAVAFIAPIEPN